MGDRLFKVRRRGVARHARGYVLIFNHEVRKAGYEKKETVAQLAFAHATAMVARYTGLMVTLAATRALRALRDVCFVSLGLRARSRFNSVATARGQEGESYEGARGPLRDVAACG